MDTNCHPYLQPHQSTKSLIDTLTSSRRHFNPLQKINHKKSSKLLSKSPILSLSLHFLSIQIVQDKKIGAVFHVFFHLFLIKDPCQLTNIISRKEFSTCTSYHGILALAQGRRMKPKNSSTPLLNIHSPKSILSYLISPH